MGPEDNPADADPHHECAAEIDRLAAKLKQSESMYRAAQRVITRHVEWRAMALGFMKQVIDERGCKDEWPALAEFIEQSESRIVASSSDQTSDE